MSPGRVVLSESSANKRTVVVTKKEAKATGGPTSRKSNIPRPNSFDEDVYPILGTPPNGRNPVPIINPNHNQLTCISPFKLQQHSSDSKDPIDIMVANSDRMVLHIEQLRRKIASLSDWYEREKERASVAEDLLKTERNINAQLLAQLVAMRRRNR